VPVVAEPAAVAALAGEWTGSYERPAAGRGGNIVFRLEAGRDTAEGDVVMVPRSGAVPLKPAAPGSPGTLARAMAPGQVLSIRFVRVQGGTLSGVLDPCQEPECGCVLHTRFTGTLAGDRLRGTFVTCGEPRGTVTGTWSVTRGGP
jgi:hypothetical protein